MQAICCHTQWLTWPHSPLLRDTDELQRFPVDREEDEALEISQADSHSARGPGQDKDNRTAGVKWAEWQTGVVP